MLFYGTHEPAQSTDPPRIPGKFKNVNDIEHNSLDARQWRDMHQVSIYWENCLTFRHNLLLSPYRKNSQKAFSNPARSLNNRYSTLNQILMLNFNIIFIKKKFL